MDMGAVRGYCYLIGYKLMFDLGPKEPLYVEDLKASLFNVLRQLHAKHSDGEPDNVDLDRLATKFSFAVVEALRNIKEEDDGRPQAGRI